MTLMLENASAGSHVMSGSEDQWGVSQGGSSDFFQPEIISLNEYVVRTVTQLDIHSDFELPVNILM